MKGAIASVDFYLFEGEQAEGRAGPRRVTLTITAPERRPDGSGWGCRVALADLHRPEVVGGIDSVAALVSALDRVRGWVADLRARGIVLSRDRAGQSVFESI